MGLYSVVYSICIKAVSCLLPFQLQSMVALERGNSNLLILPPEDQVFAWTQFCDIHDVSHAGSYMQTANFFKDFFFSTLI